jgi:zinc transporter ZupT
MTKEERRNALIYFVLGAVVGVVGGFIVGFMVYEAVNPALWWITAGSGLASGLLGIVLKENMAELWSWLHNIS